MNLILLLLRLLKHIRCEPAFVLVIRCTLSLIITL